MSLVEILVAVVLLGTAILATLVALRATVVATRIERDHAKAGQWLESAAKLVQAADFGNCSLVDSVPTSATNALNDYQAAVDSAETPYGWQPSQIEISAGVEVWDGTTWIPYSTSSACLDDFNLRIQRVTIKVTGPDGDIIEDIEVVKSG